ncbi:DUF6443 domain-containing protein [uncultured Aquimarina sp.]|uniref:DUF6443 domain-containing protein n=1 Tax=uncultured Aquimarina sp. TaxID=575652 RepID=UPI00261F64A2|nr:DUF6443 domain-containing protein [uncultured Aquimarina sp.]
MKNILTYISYALLFVSIAIQAQTPATITKDGNYTITGNETLTASQSIILKPNSWIKPGSIFTAQIIEEAYIPVDLSNNENYIFNRLFQTEMTEADLTEGIEKNSDVIENVIYFDGLGRPKQSIGIRASPDKDDIITHITYDEYGRQDKQYLPYTENGMNGNFKNNALTRTNLFYNTTKYENTTNPYSQSIFENSPLNRVLEQASPGESWKYDPNNVSENNVSYTYDKTFDNFSYNFGVSDLIGVGAGGGGGSITIVNNRLTLTINGSWAAYPLITDQPIAYLYTNPLIPINEDLGQLTNSNGDLLPYTIRIEGTTPGSASQLIISAIGTPVNTTNIDYSITVSLPDLGTDTYTYQKRESTNHTIGFNYEVNREGTGTVLDFSVGSTFQDGITIPTLELERHFEDRELLKNITKDENWTPADGRNRTTEEFTDFEGRIVLKRTYNDNEPHDTYYVYDHYGNLSFVIPPKVNTEDDVSVTELSELCYQYRYDSKNRLVEKKIPGKGWEYIVYDNLDRPVLTQDANQAAKTPTKEWLFTKYDVFGRVVYTGIYKDNKSRIDLQKDHFDIKTADQNYETKVTSGTGYDNTYYTNTNFPNTNLEVLTINYYDNYYFDKATLSLPTHTYEVAIVNANDTDPIKTRSLATGGKVKVLNTNHWITTIIGYNNKARPLFIGNSNSYLVTKDIVESKLDFAGKVLETKTIHTKGANTPIVAVNTFTYDHMGRLLDQNQNINNQPEERIISNTYDELGRLESKAVGGTSASISAQGSLSGVEGGLQKVDYTYNVRGWLTDINDVNDIGDDLFSFRINYNTITENLSADALYNGNISETIWKTANDNTKRSYGYQYDALNRITAGFDDTADKRYSLSSIGYDKNGNITNLVRNGQINPAASNFGVMDNLAYTYSENGIGNQLSNVTDSSGVIEGFKDGNASGNDYLYDDNGNMILDKNKNIRSITYNHLNLPESIEFVSRIPGQEKRIDYVYNAAGIKVRKVITNNVNVNTTDYAGNYIYTSNYSLGLPPGPNNSSEKVLKFINHPEGYVEPVFATGTSREIERYDYVYQLKDHLGNIRISFSDRDKDGKIDILRNDADIDGDGDLAQEILQEKNYYPFGLQHKGYNDLIISEHKYGYNGKENEQSLGLNLTEMTFRQYDPTLGRFNAIDRLAELAPGITPYRFGFNNPITFSDPSGLFEVNGETVGADGLTNSQWVSSSRQGANSNLQSVYRNNNRNSELNNYEFPEGEVDFFAPGGEGTDEVFRIYGKDATHVYHAGFFGGGEEAEKYIWSMIEWFEHNYTGANDILLGAGLGGFRLHYNSNHKAYSKRYYGFRKKFKSKVNLPKPGKFRQKLKSFLRTGKYSKSSKLLGKFGAVGTVLTLAVAANDIRDGTLSTSTAVDLVILGTVGVVALVAATPVVVAVGTVVAIYGALDYAFDISETLDNKFGEIKLWD